MFNRGARGTPAGAAEGARRVLSLPTPQPPR